MNEKNDEWDDYVDGAVFAVNTNKSTTTKYTPFFLMYGRQPRLPFEVEKLLNNSEEEPVSELAAKLGNASAIDDYVQNMTERRDILFPKVEDNINSAQEKQKQTYLKRKGITKCSMKDGDLVLKRNMLQKTKQGHKMEDQWIGPYVVEGLDKTNGTCSLRQHIGGNLLKSRINIKDLKIYQQQPSMPSCHPQPPPSVDKQSPPCHPHPPPSVDKQPIPPCHPQSPPSVDKQSSPPCHPHPPPSVDKQPSPPCHPQPPPSVDKQPSPPCHPQPPPSVDKQSSPPCHPQPPPSVDKQSSPPCHPQPPPSVEKQPMNKDALDKIIENLEEKALVKLYLKVQNEIEEIVLGREKSWRFELLNTGKSNEFPKLKPRDLPMNVHFGGYDDDQIGYHH
ncbi:hypothetical protein QZH41_007931 [Actinostola sp. cb2023]|nr:hypothetical protein QZH41_007931 [Actinostola sp. cb2023]